MDIFATITCFYKYPYLNIMQLTRIDQNLYWVYIGTNQQHLAVKKVNDAGFSLMKEANLSWEEIASVQIARRISEMTGFPYLGDVSLDGFEKILNKIPYEEFPI